MTLGRHIFGGTSIRHRLLCGCNCHSCFVMLDDREDWTAIVTPDELLSCGVGSRELVAIRHSRAKPDGVAHFGRTKSSFVNSTPVGNHLKHVEM